MEDPRSWAEQHSLGSFLPGLVDELGVECVEDLQLVTEADLRLIGVKSVQPRRLLRLVASRAAVGPVPGPQLRGSGLDQRSGVLRHVSSAPAAIPELSSTPPLSLCPRPLAGAGSSSTVCRSGGVDDGSSRFGIAGDEEREHDKDVHAISPPVKRRKAKKSSSEQREVSRSIASLGVGRLRLLFKYANGTPQASSPEALSKGAGHATPAVRRRGVCKCAELLESLECHFLLAKRTWRDAKDNWTVHEACARTHLVVPNCWLARCHAQAVEASHLTIRTMAKSELVSSPNVTALMSRISRPEDCLLSTSKFFQYLSYNSTVEVVYIPEHGLAGVPSNRTKVTEQKKFTELVRAHRSPTGRTADKSGPFHWAYYYLDSRWDILRNSRSAGDTHESFSAAFNIVLVAEGLPKVHDDTLLRWLRSLFGSSKIVDGISVPSDERTNIYPHKTDACATCERYHFDLRSEIQALKRHLQQLDQGSLNRREAIEEIRLSLEDLEDGLTQHEEEAAGAWAYHNNCVCKAAALYEAMVNMFDDVMSTIVSAEQQQPATRHSAAENLIEEASRGWFDVSSDYQQDKSVPLWNKSPQPGRTYFLSGSTHYVHIFCAESCGTSSGPSRFSRNVVYTRSQRVCGSKSSDDTLSTLSDMLLGSVSIGGDLPPVYPTGSGPDGGVLPRETAI